ncbi:hypothetical protein [Flectobacillus sp. BAB-3569]|uniref:hypothetical protein n=1 Tax=Flectobacillus sp. BAB-3569 TaxID=1509483 RepID=UPI000BA43919|nr:hypothetical protein [Flectobacillus sp. BAB-3569]PAC33302.1 hypothetical protein BWI92_02000 [Flectobacillus sp. BAB-3569]
MEYRKIALLDKTGKISYELLQQIAKAIQIQLQRDVSPKWDVSGEVRAFRTFGEIPAGFWTVSILEETENKFNGTHWYDSTTNIPYAQARLTDWVTQEYTQNHLTKVLSEEIIEMCIDPYGQRIVRGKDFEDNTQEVEFLVELADPIANPSIGYYINDIFVTNFIYPSYFNVTHVAGTKYDHLGLLKKPLDLFDRSYQIFRRAGQWFKAFMVQGKIVVRKSSEGVPLEAFESKKLLQFLAFILSLFLVVFLIFRFLGGKLNSKK